MKGGGVDGPLVVNGKVTVRSGSIDVDYAGSSSQLPRAVNAPPNYVFAFSVYGLKTMLSPEIPNNDRSFRPICTHAPLGSILNPRYPAAVSARHVVAQLLPSTLMTALAKAVPERVQATPVSPSCSFHMSGEHRGRPTQW